MATQMVHTKSSSGYVIKIDKVQAVNLIPDRETARTMVGQLRTIYPSRNVRVIRNGRLVKGL